jgi:hypothetical protein
MKNTTKEFSFTVCGVKQTPSDSNLTPIAYGSTVHVPEPTPNDIWNLEFVGTVEDYFENGDILVSDGDGDVFQMSPHITTIVNNND